MLFSNCCFTLPLFIHLVCEGNIELLRVEKPPVLISLFNLRYYLKISYFYK